MPKTFYTEKDIEDLVRRGVRTLRVDDSVVLTSEAYEQAQRFGLHLDSAGADAPPEAPVRPYLNQPAGQPVGAGQKPAQSDLHRRIRDAVTARLGSKVDPELLDVIITRVLRNTGVR